MEILGLIDLPGWLVGTLITVLTVCLYTMYKQSYFRRRGIPTKPTVFFFGDLIDMMKKGLGYIDEEMVRKNGKVFGLYTGNLPTLVISDTDMIKQILVKDFAKFTDRVRLLPMDDKWNNALSIADGDHWRFLRSTLSPTFTSGKMREMSPYILQCLDTLHEVINDNIEKNPQGFDVIPLLSAYTMDVICMTGFGMDINAQKGGDNKLLHYSKEFLEFNGTRNFGFLFQIFFPDLLKVFSFVKTNPVSEECFNYFMTTLTTAFRERRQENSQHRDLLQLLINAHKGDIGEKTDASEAWHQTDRNTKRGLTDEEVLTNSIIFMLAGYDTTATTLSWLIYDLVTNPECQEKLIEEIDSEVPNKKPTYDNVFKLQYLDMVVSETLRVHPPGNRFNRKAVEDVEINGILIEKGMDCTFATEALHFMPEYWDEPRKYDPMRFSPENKSKINEYAYMPFGQGPRNCVGKRLALLEVKATLVSLLQKYRFRITDKLEVPIRRKKLGFGKPDKPVFVKVEKRSKN